MYVYWVKSDDSVRGNDNQQLSDMAPEENRFEGSGAEIYREMSVICLFLLPASAAQFAEIYFTRARRDIDKVK